MKKLLLIILLTWTGIRLEAQNYLPQNFSFAMGGGATIGLVEGTNNSFFDKHGKRAGYDLTAEGRYYFTSTVGLGLQYDYLNITKSLDQMNAHFIRPNLIIRYQYDDQHQAWFITLGAGYMDYRERTHQRRDASILYHKNYGGLSIGLGYEFSLFSGISGMLRADIITANWFVNPDKRLFNTDGYDDGVDHHWFKNNITFVNIGFAVQLGR